MRGTGGRAAPRNRARRYLGPDRTPEFPKPESTTAYSRGPEGEYKDPQQEVANPQRYHQLDQENNQKIKDWRPKRKKRSEGIMTLLLPSLTQKQQRIHTTKVSNNQPTCV